MPSTCWPTPSSAPTFGGRFAPSGGTGPSRFHDGVGGGGGAASTFSGAAFFPRVDFFAGAAGVSIAGWVSISVWVSFSIVSSRSVLGTFLSGLAFTARVFSTLVGFSAGSAFSAGFFLAVPAPARGLDAGGSVAAPRFGFAGAASLDLVLRRLVVAMMPDRFRQNRRWSPLGNARLVNEDHGAQWRASGIAPKSRNLS